MLREVLSSAGIDVRLDPDLPIRGLSYDSRMVKPGDLFFAIPGAHVDGHKFLDEAVRRGAAVAVIEKELPSPLPVLRVTAVLAAMSRISDAFYTRPSARIPVIGITGTNGKTTTTFLIEDLLRSQAGGPVAGPAGEQPAVAAEEDADAGEGAHVLLANYHSQSSH